MDSPIERFPARQMKRASKSVLIVGYCIAIAMIAACAILALAFWPRPGKVERKIVEQIDHSYPDHSACLIRISGVTWFAWDRVYAFDSSIAQKEREKTLGTRDSGFVEFSPQLVFTKNEHIVYEESEPTDFEHPTKDEVVFDDPDQSSGPFGPETLFSVSEQIGPAGKYFLLKPVQ